MFVLVRSVELMWSGLMDDGPEHYKEGNENVRDNIQKGMLITCLPADLLSYVTITTFNHIVS